MLQGPAPCGLFVRGAPLMRVLLAVAGLAGCYAAPEPECGFICGPGGACPASYTCASDHHCHHDGATASPSCGAPPPDAAPPDTRTAPRIVNVTPADGATGVVVDVHPAAVADQALMSSGPGLVLLDGDVPIRGTIVVSPAAMEIGIIPDAQLAANHHFTVTITGDVTNAAGDPLGPYSWSFDTGADTVPPHLQSTAPAEASLGAPVTTGIRVTFDEPVQNVDDTSFTALDGTTPVIGTVVELGPRTYELRPVSSLSHSSTITVSLSAAIVDTSNIVLTPTLYTFNTAP